MTLKPYFSSSAKVWDDISWVYGIPEAGYSGWEIVSDGNYQLANPDCFSKIQEVVTATGLGVTVHAPYGDLNLATLNDPIWRESIRQVCTCIKHASALTDKVTIHPGYLSPVGKLLPRKVWEGFGYGGSYVVDRNQITITGGGWCQGPDLDLSSRHRYTWTWDGSLLRMTPVGHDGCTDRQVALAEMAPRFVFPTGRYESTDNVTGSDYVFVSFWDGGTMNLGKRQSDVGWGSSHGYYILDGSTIVISDSYCAEQGFETAHYTWKWDGSRLRMKTLTDGCTARKTALAEMTPIVEAPPTPTTSAAVVTESPRIVG